MWKLGMASKEDREERARQTSVAQYMSAAVSHSSTPIMMADHNLKVTYANLRMRELLKTEQDTFRAQWHNFEPARIVGVNFDSLHDKPSYLRQILSLSLIHI